MKVLQLSLRVPWPLTDGGAQATYGLSKMLKEQEVDLTLFALNTRKHFIAESELGELRKLARFITTEIDTTPKLLHALWAFAAGKPYNIQRFFNRQHADSLKQLLEKESFDIVELEGVYLAQYIPTIRKANPLLPIVLRAHNVEFDIWQGMATVERNPLKRMYYWQLAASGMRYEIAAIQDVDAILAITPKDAERFKSLGFKGPIHWLPAAWQGDVLPPLTGSMPPKVAFLGSLEWLPNVQGLEWFLTHVWPKVLSSVPEAHFTIAGRNPSPSVLSWSYPNVEVVGLVDDPKQYLADKTVVVVPLLSGSGMRLKVLEALALGKAVVSTKLGAEGIYPLPHAENEQNPLLLADSPEDFAVALIRLLSDSDFRFDVASGGNAYLNRYFRANSIARDLMTFLKSVIPLTSANK
jgi:polysaccharide biosynthesis protein PslH